MAGPDDHPLFQGFANVWTPAARSARVGRRPVRIVVAGEPVVLFRDRAGRAGALIDRCPHRGVALSGGRVGEDGCLECPFHGWRFDTRGVNRRIPLNPEARLDRMPATALAVREIGELIWLRTAPGADAAEDPVAPEGLAAPGLARAYTERVWRCHWTRAMENMLDSPHLPFVHRRTIGRPLRRRMTDASRMDIGWEDTSWGGRASAALDGVDGGALLEFHRPNIMSLLIPAPGRHLRIHAIVTPSDPGRTRLTVVGSRDFLRSPAFTPLFAWMNGRIADEDRAVVESSGPAEVPAPGREPSVGTDRATLQFRRYYYATLRDSFA
ncbi:Rieske 2Fe-2S domain-containing protein [Caulobacter sp. KR2-114]|uniref:Rieske 2Fe-2S domain-containing protein n=1 Tax=Caulobacter sp. KR2-114 TaxID=3400912 RepID=UPI003BFDECA5